MEHPIMSFDKGSMNINQELWSPQTVAFGKMC